ncbi:hypothetical protein [Albimonas pacifica]|uniref:Autotransporter domain-containing protein n=1 Tax=Albimonas pacifica TaxID=1114924 RepID=A0A1I3EJV5_9RHOB|nr:hypothetical protein [Albimonas pacifica]SFH99285.1 hypothetical protein SAMN05216258_103426 [Albimonas pacifica]
MTPRLAARRRRSSVPCGRGRDAGAGRPRGRAWAAPLALVALGAPAAEAQTVAEVRKEIRAAARSSDFGKSVLGLTGFAALPGVSASNFTIDDGAASRTELSRLVGAPSRRFEDLGVLGGDLYAEATVSWFTAETDYPTFLPGSAFAAAPRNRIDAYTVVGGLGVAYDLTPSLSLTPIVTAGWGMVQDDTTFAGPGARRLDRATDDLLFNWDVQEILYGGALRLDYETPLPGDVNFTGRGRLNWVFGTTYSASSRVLEGDTRFGVVTAHGELDGPTTHSVFGRELRWILFAAGAWITGDGAEALGVGWIAEFGLGAELVDREVARGLGVEGVSLRISAITGDDLFGWSVGGGLEF